MTAEEQVAIKSAVRLASRWPASLMMFAASGRIDILRSDWDRDQPYDPQVICTLRRIVADGGAPE